MECFAVVCVTLHLSCLLLHCVFLHSLPFKLSLHIQFITHLTVLVLSLKFPCGPHDQTTGFHQRVCVFFYIVAQCFFLLFL